MSCERDARVPEGRAVPRTADIEAPGLFRSGPVRGAVRAGASRAVRL